MIISPPYKAPKISKDMVELASHILETKTSHFDLKQFDDEYENALKALVKRKAVGKTIKVLKKAENVIDLMTALKQSLKGRVASTSHRANSDRASRRVAVKKPSLSTAR